MTILPLILQSVSDLLKTFVQNEDWTAANLALAFGEEIDTSALSALGSKLRLGDLSALPTVDVLSQRDLGGALGAYAGSLDRIFIAQEFLDSATHAQIVAVVLEELGHAIDARLNPGRDSIGDEGEIFADLLLNRPTAPTAYTENDSGTVIIEGQFVVVEQNTPSFTVIRTGGLFGQNLPPTGGGLKDIDGDGINDISLAFFTGFGALDAVAVIRFGLGVAGDSQPAWRRSTDETVVADGDARNEAYWPAFRGNIANSDDNWSKVNFSSGDGWVQWRFGNDVNTVNPLLFVREAEGIDLSAAQAFVAASFTVTNTNDSGLGSLRQAILDTNANPGADTIIFTGSTFADASPDIITLTSGELAVTDSVTIQGTGANLLTIRGNNNSRIFNFEGAGVDTFNLSGITITGGRADFGAGIRGQLTEEGDHLNIDEVFVTGNTATASGGGINIVGLPSVTSYFNISNSTVSNNTGGQVGGISLNNIQNADLKNVTISDNNGTVVGGIANLASVSTNAINDLTLTNVIIANNTGTGLLNITQDNALRATSKYSNSIFTNNTTNISNSGTGASIQSLGYNISSDDTGNLTATGDQPNTNPLLGLLQNNGGPVPTHALLPGSPAIGAGNTTLTTDQRGISRPQGSNDDIGAFEYVLPTVSLTATDNTATEQLGNTGTFQLTRVIPNGGSTGSLPVQLTLSGTASANDYNFSASEGTVSVSGNTVTVTFNSDSNTVNVTVTPVDDIQAEPDETVTLTLNSSLNYNQETNASPSTVTILANDMVSINGNGDLVITDVSGTNINDRLTLSFSANGTNLIITDTTNLPITIDAGVSGVSGASGNGTSIAIIPLSSFAGSITANTLGGNDILTVDFSGANPIPNRNITFNGGSQTTTGDKLVLTGGFFPNTTYNYINENDGSISLDGKVITYTGLEPIASTVTATNVILSYSTTAEAITVTSASDTQTTVDSTAGEITTFNNPTNSLTIDGGGVTGANTFNLNSISSGFAGDLILNGSGYANGDVVNLNANPNPNGFTIDNVQNINVATAIALTTIDTPDDGDVSWQAGQTINFASGSSLTTTNGLIDLNAQANVTGADYIGLNLNNATIASSHGNISINATGGGTGGDRFGILLQNGGKITSTGTGANPATITIMTQGSATGSEASDGIRLLNLGSSINSKDGAISLTGIGGNGTGFNRGVVIVDNGLITSVKGPILVDGTGNGTVSENYGVFLQSGGKIASEGTEADASTITVKGQGSIGATGNNNGGVRLENATIESVNGAIAVTGNGGSGTNANYGVYVVSGGVIASTGTANINVTGTGSTLTTGVANDGVRIESVNSKISSTGTGAIAITGTAGNGTSSNRGVVVFNNGLVTSAKGNITVNGTARGTGSENYGVYVISSGTNGGVISSTGTGADAASINITGQGSLNSTTTGNDGVRVEGTNSKISSVAGAIFITGTAGTGSQFNRGTWLASNGLITSETGNITVNGTGGNTGISNYGVALVSGGSITSIGTGANAAQINVTGQGAATGTAGDNDGVRIDGTNSKITSIAGAISLTGTAGNGTNGNRGVVVFNNGVVTSATGNITVNGTGRGTGSNNHGVYVVSSSTNGGVISSTGTGAINITGQGSVNATGNDNDGVRIEGANSKVLSSNGNIAITGTGGGTGTSQLGVRITGGAQVQSTGTATISVTGFGSNTGNGTNYGVQVTGANSAITSFNGNITVNGTGRGTGSNNRGVSVEAGGVISSTGSATITVMGQGSVNPLSTSENYGVFLQNGGRITSKGAGVNVGAITVTGQGATGVAGNNNDGIRLQSATIESIDGDIDITGTGGGTGTTQLGVRIFDGSQVKSTGTATISVTGFGSNTGNGTNYGVQVTGTNSAITSFNGNITVDGTGQGVGDNNRGVSVEAGGVISSTGSATITVMGQGSVNPLSTGRNRGVRVEGANSKITSVNGAISVKGTAGASAATGGVFNYGVQVLFSGQISSTGVGEDAATITIEGNGGSISSTASLNAGVDIEQDGKVTSVDGAINVTGTGGSGTNSNFGVLVLAGGEITSTGTGVNAATINVTGQGSTTASGTDNDGVNIEGAGSKITSVDGAINVTGTGGSGTNNNTGVLVLSGGEITSTGTGATAATITIEGTGGSGTNSDGIRLQNAGSKIQSNSGAINLNGRASGANFGINLLSGTVITSATGNINLLSSTINLGDTASFTTAGDVFINQDDATLGATTLGATVNVTAGNLHLNDIIKIDYNSAPSRFDTIDLTGAVDLVGSTLNLDLTNFVPAVNGFYTLINNDGADAVTGIFTGLAEGAIVSAKSTYNLLITYKGDATATIPSLANIGTGNDVQIYVNQAPTAVAVPNASLPENTDTTNRVKVADIAVTDDGVGTNTLSLSGPDVDFFEILGTELFVKAGTTLDFETKKSYEVNVEVDDTSVGSTPDAMAPFTLTLTDAVEKVTTPNRDSIKTGSGDDFVTTTLNNLRQRDRIDGGLGNDTLIFVGAGSPTPLKIDISQSSQVLVQPNFIGLPIPFLFFPVPWSKSSIKNFENVDASGFTGDLNLTGSNLGQVLKGGSGNDRIFGLAGDDKLTGGLGNDLLYLGDGSAKDKVYYNAGDGTDKVFQFNRADDQIIFSGIPNITVTENVGSTQFFNSNQLLLTVQGVTDFTLADVGASKALTGAVFSF